MLSFVSGHDPGGYRYLRIEVRVVLPGGIAAGGRAEEHGRAECAR